MPLSHGVNGAQEAFEGGREGSHKTFQPPIENTKKTSGSFPFHRVIGQLSSLCIDQQGFKWNS